MLANKFKYRCYDVISTLNKYFSAIHLNPSKTIFSLKSLPRYTRDKKLFSSKIVNEEWPVNLFPIVSDWDSHSAILGEYFWQDLYVAKRIIKKNPKRHIDVGSRIDGFIANLACVRAVEIFDIRPLPYKIENVSFVQWDLTQSSSGTNVVADCVSCLHTLEHIGLGRYGDKIDPEGWKKGLTSLTNLVKPHGGELWLSVPIGRQRVEFNAHRIFAPGTIRDAANKNGLELVEFHYLKENRIVHSQSIENDFAKLSKEHYNLGIFYFKKK